MDNYYCDAPNVVMDEHTYTLYCNKNADFMWEHLFSHLFPGLNESHHLKSKSGINPHFRDKKR